MSEKGSMVSYKGRGGEVKAYLARPTGQTARPAVIVIHEAFGLNDHTKDVANRFASLGYVAFAPHLYSYGELAEIFSPANSAASMRFMRTLAPERRGDPAYMQQKLAELPADEREGVSKLMQKMFAGMPLEDMAEDLVLGAEYIGSQSFVTKGKVGSVGFCMGGGLSISLACRRPLAACVVFYGPNPSPIELVERIQGPVLGLYGGDDMRINADLDKLVAAMAKYRKDFQMKIYPGAAHAFFNDTSPQTYREGAAKDAWVKVREFFAGTLGGQP